MPIQFPGGPSGVHQNNNKTSAAQGGQTTPTNSNSSQARSPSSPSQPVDRVTLGERPSSPEKSSSFFRSIKQKFSAASSSLRPLDFSETQKSEGQVAAGTMDRLAGQDGKWSAEDVTNNMAQIHFPRNLKGIAAKQLVLNKLMDSHAIPDSKRQEILENAAQIRRDNPDIAKMRKLERYDPSKFKKPETLQKYNSIKGELTKSLSAKGLMPVSLDQIQDFGRSADLLKAKLNQVGLPQPKPGTPMNPRQFRQLFEGKSPLSTQF